MPVDHGTVKRFMALFTGNRRGHGFGDGKRGTKFIVDKNKWEYDKTKGCIGWKWNVPGEADFAMHLNGDMALGIAPLFDNGLTPRLELDIDGINNSRYEFDYVDEMRKLKESGLPWVVYRTKSAGMRCILFFNEPIEAQLARKIGELLNARLGYSGNEIFPKQTQLAKEDDAPSWTFVPYGPTFDVFAEQCCMSETGHAMTLEESLDWAEGRIMAKEDALAILSAEQKVKTEARVNGKKRHGNGKWIEEEGYVNTVKATFCDGPVCQYDIAMQKCNSFQHNFLFDVGIFLKKKYSDNWEEALSWVNENVLVPRGDHEKMRSIIRDLKHKGYEYRCKDEPICSHCNPYACRRMTYGVGQGGNGVDHRELGMVIWLSDPRRFIINVGDTRMHFAAEELLRVSRYRDKCLAAGVDFPETMKQLEWDQVIKRSIEQATEIEPPALFKTNAGEIEMLEWFLSIHIHNGAHEFGDEFLHGKVGDVVRVKVDEKRIWIKWKKCVIRLRGAFNLRERDLEKFRLFLITRGIEHGRTEGRDWYRSTISISFDVLDEDLLNGWLYPEHQQTGS